MRKKLQTAKKQVIRQTPKVLALAGAAAGGAVLMSRYRDDNAYLVSAHRAIFAEIKNSGKALVFETPMHGSFVLASTDKL